MIHVWELLDRKDGDIRTIGPDISVLDAARLMNRHRIGALCVMKGPELVGILTERDVMTRVVAEARAPAHTAVESVMTTPVLTCSPETKLSHARSTMRDQRVRHLPVLDRDRVVGMVSIGDLNGAENATLTETIQQMETYISGEPM